MKFDDFYDLYVKIPKKYKMIIDLVETTLKVD